MSDLHQRLDFALDCLAQFSPPLLALFNSRDFKSIERSDGSVVTKADIAAEEKMRALILKRYPNDSIVGEELGNLVGSTSDVWYLDPIDGTQSFVCGVPLFSTMIGMQREGEVVLGALHFPALCETLHAYKGGGAFWKSRYHSEFVSAKVSNTSSVEQAIFCTSGADYFKKANLSHKFQRLVDACSRERTWGDSYGHLLVATGRVDIMVDPLMYDWDCVPLKIIIEEAGGCFGDLQGNRTAKGKSALSANPVLFEQVVSLLK